ncbi:MAG: [Synergistaceae bacterium]|nr:[FeFe] hydrogenase H-cluster maturation GTPase HydF [Synergistaceae bacterium]
MGTHGISGSSLNDTPSGERVHIAFFGLRNAGKSSLVNAVTGQDLAVVSDVKGTTTDPVRKAMELLPLGPVVIVDTPGLDDEGTLGELRVKRALQVLGNCDVGVLVHDATQEFAQAERELLDAFEARKLPYVIAHNKADLLALDRGRGGGVAVNGVSGTLDSVSANSYENVDTYPKPADAFTASTPSRANISPQSEPADALTAFTPASENENISTRPHSILVSALTGKNINALKEHIASLAKHKAYPEKRLVADLLTQGDIVILVVPIDKAAPKGRLILPQQQTIRDILDSGCSALVCQENELSHILASLTQQPRIVITDSQVFAKVDAIVPKNIPITSFSILFARYKGDLKTLVHGAEKLASLHDGDRVLISEGCTHHRQCGDIGTQKLPAWIRKYSHANPEFSFTSGGEFPDTQTLKNYSLIVHCGGCMLNQQEMTSRLERAISAGVPIVNYGVAIAQMHGILQRSLEPFSREL